jgi:hypothetical protein
MSAANTLTFAQIQMGVGLFEGKALVLHRAKFRPSFTSLHELAAATDRLTMALTTSNRLTSIIDVTDPSVICSVDLIPIGVAVEIQRLPYVEDYTNLPGGGKLLAANPLWCACWTSGAVAASSMKVDIEFSFVDLSPQDYLEVLQSMFPANVV